MSYHLLTVKEVAALLNVDEGTVYAHKDDLGGFYPAGIRVLRFNPEVIYGYMAGQGQRALAVSVRIPGGKNNRARIRYPARGGHRKGNPLQGNQGGIKTDPSHHGL